MSLLRSRSSARSQWFLTDREEMILFIETGKSFEGPASGEQLAGPSFYLSGRRKYYEKFKKGSCDFRNSGSSAGNCMPMFFAMTDSNLFRASWGVAILVPILGYLFWMMYRLLNKRKRSAEGKMKNVIFDVGLVLVDFDWQGYLNSFGFPEEDK